MNHEVPKLSAKILEKIAEGNPDGEFIKAKDFGESGETIHRQAKWLIEDGYASTFPSGLNNSTPYLWLTSKGQRFVDECKKPWWKKTWKIIVSMRNTLMGLAALFGFIGSLAYATNAVVRLWVNFESWGIIP